MGTEKEKAVQRRPESGNPSRYISANAIVPAGPEWTAEADVAILQTGRLRRDPAARKISSIPWFRKRPVGLDFEKPERSITCTQEKRWDSGLPKFGKSI